MEARAITEALGGRWCGAYGVARCPSHPDRSPSLKVSDDPRKTDGVDVHCFAGCAWEDVKVELARLGLLPDFRSRNPQLLTSLLSKITTTESDDADRLRRATNIWRTAKPLPGTLGEKYFVKTRGLDLAKLGDLSHALRWHADLHAVIAGMSDPMTGEGVGVHRTFIETDGTKRERMMLGKQGVVRLSSDDDVLEGLGICEGIEDGLAILVSGWAPVWAATNAGGVERFPVLPGIEALTIFHDKDEAGTRAAELCAQRWASAGREVFL